MPIYEYLCTACSNRADILLGINDPGPQFCPACGREGTMRKQFAPPTIHFKGSGWAKKDRGSSSTRASSAASSKSGDSSGDGTAAKSGGDGGGTSTSSGSTSGEASSSGNASSSASTSGGSSSKDGG
jgi:putative FmdB family regulatory protein